MAGKWDFYAADKAGEERAHALEAALSLLLLWAELPISSLS